ncbi:MAG: hypothetical protein R3E67_02650 [Pseudomonadales bacterium]
MAFQNHGAQNLSDNSRRQSANNINSVLSSSSDSVKKSGYTVSKRSQQSAKDGECNNKPETSTHLHQRKNLFPFGVRIARHVADTCLLASERIGRTAVDWTQ